MTACSSSYAGGDRLFLPVENIELLSRYGSDEQGVQLDKLGGGAWQAKKAKLKERILRIAENLIRTAAARELKPGDVLPPPEGAYDEFCARFPYEETEDQLTAIDAVLEDLQKGRPMDRLVCGDVGFGKTEVALRSAFVAAMNGKQVAVVVPTTLLARQHFATFQARFKGLPLNIAQASRLVPRKDLEQAKEGLARRAMSTSWWAPMRCWPRVDQVPRSGPADHRRGAAFRREAQGTPEGDAHQRACADADRDAHSAHPAAGAVGRARALAHHHAAAGPSGGSHLHLALRSRHHPREPAARALPRRPEFLCGAAHHATSTRSPASCARTCRR